jgi:hypothetical protein
MRVTHPESRLIDRKKPVLTRTIKPLAESDRQTRTTRPAGHIPSRFGAVLSHLRMETKSPTTTGEQGAAAATPPSILSFLFSISVIRAGLPALGCSALHAQGNKLLLYRRSNSGTTALYIPGTTPHPNGFPRRKVGRTVCIPTSSSPPIRWRRLRQHRSTTKPNKSSQASPVRVELVQFSSFFGAAWAACSVAFSFTDSR